MLINYIKTLSIVYFVSFAMLVSCKETEPAAPTPSVKETPVPTPIPVPIPVPIPTPPPVPTATTIFNLNWNLQADGLYAQSAATTDFGNISGWNSRVNIADKGLRVTLLKNELSGAGGIVANVNLEKANEYKVTYDVMFPTDFIWGLGGKVGFGFRIGEGNTGCDKADDGNGGSARLMWYTSSNGTTRFKPYMYYKDMPESCGDNLIPTSAYPATGSIEKGKWYTVVMRVKSNTGSNKDGQIEISIDGNTILNESIRWTTNDTQRLINRLAFSTFRGGSGDSWKVGTDTYIHFDNLKLERLN